MKPLAAACLAKAERSLGEARAMAKIEFVESAGRAAYLAAYHAAQAYIFDGTDKIARTHSGARSEFARLAKDDPRIDRKFPTFLARAYNLKSVADYGLDSDIGVSREEAMEVIRRARADYRERFGHLEAMMATVLDD